MSVLWKIALTVALVVAWLLVRWVLRRFEDFLHDHASRGLIWSEKALSVVVGAVALIAFAAIWFENSGHLATFSGIVVGGIAFASQRLFQSLAGFLVIVFGRTFDLGERIEMGGVRGDVLDIGLLKTTVMEMGVPDQMQPDPKHWVQGRQYTGRIVTLTNDAVFEKPVYNYSRSLDFIWEELEVPIKYGADLRRAEQILLEAARAETGDSGQRARELLANMRHRVLLNDATFEPEVYVRLTDNWVLLSVRFVCQPHGVRALKNKISRRILDGFTAAGLEVASSTFEVVGLPKVQLVEAGEGEPAHGEPPEPPLHA